MGALEGKVAIITGAGHGVGRCHAELFAAEGARLVINDFTDSANDVAASINEAGGTAIGYRCDVTDWDRVANLVDLAIETYGDLDIVVNNAGITRDAMSFSMTEEQYDSVVDVHLKGHVATAHWAAIHWRTQAKLVPSGQYPRPRRIINTTSESGLFGGPSQSNYGSAKAAIIGLTMILAKELMRYGVTVNCIAPRARTQMNDMIEMFAKPEVGFDSYDPGHVSPMVAWLASDVAHDVNGQTFIVTGDEIHRVAQPRVEASILNDDQRWTVEEISRRRDDLLGAGPCVIDAWAGPKMR